MNKALARVGGTLRKGETYELDEAYARRLVEVGLAESAETGAKVEDPDKMDRPKAKRPAPKRKAERQDAPESEKA